MRMQTVAAMPASASETAVVLPMGRSVRLDMAGTEINCRKGFRAMAQGAMLGRTLDEEQGGATSKEPTYTERMAMAVRKWMVKKISTIIATVGFATAACGGIAYDQDSEQDSDVAADVEPDLTPDEDGGVEDVSIEEDGVEIPDVGPEDVEEETAMEDGGVEDSEDVPDLTEFLEDAPDVEDGVEEADTVEVIDGDEDSIEFVDGTDGEAEADVDCTSTTTIEPTRVLTGPETVCGSLMTTTVMSPVTRWSGSDCEFVGPETGIMQSKIVEFSPYLDISDLSCARTKTIRALNGDEIIVSMTPTSLESATAIVPCMTMMVGGAALDGGGPLEYDATLWNVLPTYVILEIHPPSGPSVRVNAYPTGVATVSGNRGYIITDINGAASAAKVCYIMLPTTNRTSPFTEVWVSGDLWPYTWTDTVVGSLLHGWEWDR